MRGRLQDSDIKDPLQRVLCAGISHKSIGLPIQDYEVPQPGAKWLRQGKATKNYNNNYHYNNNNNNNYNYNYNYNYNNNNNYNNYNNYNNNFYNYNYNYNNNYNYNYNYYYYYYKKRMQLQQYISCNAESFKENSIYCKIYFVDVLPAIFFREV